MQRSGTSNENARRLASAVGFDQVFELVKRAAEDSLGLHRAGLTLVLGDLSNDIGAYHQMSSNSIVVNRNIMKIVWKSTRSRAKRNAYTYMILLHEYLHSLGFEDEGQVRGLSKKISDKFLGPGHIVGEMATKPLDEFFPAFPQLAGFRDKGQYETIHRFDSSSTPYIR
ncbi:MAG: hypothetical protein OK456_06695 [Thaumarchaeota archaeon]|nr:hypothetical protein [Nitrososphaerota archaeon]